MTSFASLKGRAVIARDSAERIGAVEGLVVDPQQRRVVALHVGGKKSSGAFVSWDDISSVGDDAVMVSASGSRPANGEREQQVAGGTSLALGKRVLAEVGDILGDVDDVTIDPDTGRIDSLQVGDVAIDGGQLIGIGGYAVVVSNNGT